MKKLWLTIGVLFLLVISVQLFAQEKEKGKELKDKKEVVKKTKEEKNEKKKAEITSFEKSGEEKLKPDNDEKLKKEKDKDDDVSLFGKRVNEKTDTRKNAVSVEASDYTNNENSLKREVKVRELGTLGSAEARAKVEMRQLELEEEIRSSEEVLAIRKENLKAAQNKLAAMKADQNADQEEIKRKEEVLKVVDMKIRELEEKINNTKGKLKKAREPKPEVQ